MGKWVGRLILLSTKREFLKKSSLKIHFKPKRFDDGSEVRGKNKFYGRINGKKELFFGRKRHPITMSVKKTQMIMGMTIQISHFLGGPSLGQKRGENGSHIGPFIKMDNHLNWINRSSFIFPVFFAVYINFPTFFVCVWGVHTIYFNSILSCWKLDCFKFKCMFPIKIGL